MICFQIAFLNNGSRDEVKTTTADPNGNRRAGLFIFCGMTNFHRFKLGFDRTFWIGEIGDKSQVEVYEGRCKSKGRLSCVASQGRG